MRNDRLIMTPLETAMFIAATVLMSAVFVMLRWADSKRAMRASAICGQVPILASCPNLSSACLRTAKPCLQAQSGRSHEIKYDGYRLRVERDGDRIRLITRGGYDWTKRFPRS